MCLTLGRVHYIISVTSFLDDWESESVLPQLPNYPRNWTLKPDSRPRPKTVHKMEVASRLLIGGYVRRDSAGPTTAQTMNHGSRVAEKAESRAKKSVFPG